MIKRIDDLLEAKIKKQVTVLFEVSQKKQQNARVFSADLTLEQLLKEWPDFKGGSVEALFKNKDIKHMLICIYENHEGDTKRRITGMPHTATDKKDLMDLVNQVANSLGINITRSLEIVQK